MLTVMTDNREQDKSIEKFEETEEEEQERIEKYIEQADGLLAYQTNLPLSSTKYCDFIATARKIQSTKYEKKIKELINRLQAFPEWKQDANSDFDARKFFETSLFKNKKDYERVDWKMLKLVALYLCKQGSKARQ